MPTMLSLEILEPGQSPKNPLTDDKWLFDSNLEKVFVIEKATIKKFNDGRYPQVQLVVKEPDSGKYITIGTTARILNMIVSAAKGAAASQGLHDF